MKELLEICRRDATWPVEAVAGGRAPALRELVTGRVGHFTVFGPIEPLVDPVPDLEVRVERKSQGSTESRPTVVQHLDSLERVEDDLARTERVQRRD